MTAKVLGRESKRGPARQEELGRCWSVQKISEATVVRAPHPCGPCTIQGSRVQEGSVAGIRPPLLARRR